MDKLLEAIVENIPAPIDGRDKPLRALIFDSFYDNYRGAICHVRVVDGEVRTGRRIRMMATGAVFEVTEVGVFTPGLTPTGVLSSGEVGYVTAAIKTVRDARVGDTITDDEAPAAEPLPGYKKATPMVYCGIYPADGSRYADLRDALEKLQLNDAAVFFEPETSAALGYGFRCGFLGLLHMEIIQQRLEREYDFDLVTTAPSVIYHVYKTDGEMIVLANPANLPPPCRRSNIWKSRWSRRTS